jgi:hypothetical protein
MSQGPCGLEGLDPAPGCWAIDNVALMVVNASASISARVILVFIFILRASLVNFGIWNSQGSGAVLQVGRSGIPVADLYADRGARILNSEG